MVIGRRETDLRELRKQCFIPLPWKAHYLGSLLALACGRTLVTTDPKPTCVAPIFTPTQASPFVDHMLISTLNATNFSTKLARLGQVSLSSTANAVHTPDTAVAYYEDSKPRPVHHS